MKWQSGHPSSLGNFSSSQLLVSCDGNGFTEELIEMLPDLWSDEQQAAVGPRGGELLVLLMARDSSPGTSDNVKVQEASRGISCANR